jgi:hypothetical protein
MSSVWVVDELDRHQAAQTNNKDLDVFVSTSKVTIGPRANRNVRLVGEEVCKGQ